MSKQNDLRLAQIAKLSPEEQAEYRRYRKTAIILGFAHLLTFPLFSWPIIYFILLWATDGNQKTAVLGSIVPAAPFLIITAVILGIMRRRFQRKALVMRIGTDLL